MSDAQDLIGLLEQHKIPYEIRAEGLDIPGQITSESLEQIRQNLLRSKFLEVQNSEGDYAAWKMWRESGDGLEMPPVKRIKKKSEKQRLLDDIASSIYENEVDKASELIGFYRDFAGPIDIQKIPLSAGITVLANDYPIVEGQFGKIVHFMDKSDRYFGVCLSKHRLLAGSNDTDSLDDEFSDSQVQRNGIGYHSDLVGRDEHALGGARYVLKDEILTIWGYSVKYGRIPHALFPWVDLCFIGLKVDNKQNYPEGEQNLTLNHVLGYSLCSQFGRIIEKLNGHNEESKISQHCEDDDIPF